MTNQEILTKAITKAIDGGYNPEPLFAWIPQDKQALLEFWLNKDHPHYATVIFNHDFAKALIGTDMQNGQPRWQNFLQFIVVQDEPIKALEMFL